MMNKKTQRIVGGMIAILVTISMVGLGIFGSFAGGGVFQSPESSVSSAADTYQKLKNRVNSLSEQVKINPNNVGFQQDLGNAYFDLAISALEIAPDEAKEDLNQAISNYQNVLKTKKDINVLTNLAIAAFYGDQSDLAEKTFQEALALQPDFEQALIYYGVFLLEVKQDYSTAIAMWQKALDNNPTGPNADWLKQSIAQTRSMQENLKGFSAASDSSSTETPGTSAANTGD